MGGALKSAVLLVFMSAIGTQAQPALVTFYSTGCGWCGKDVAAHLTAGSTKIPYRGAIYDGQEKLVQNITPNRFVTFRLEAGSHSFAGLNFNEWWRAKRGNEDKDLRLTLLPNQHYYVRLVVKDKGVYSIRHYTTILTAMSCSEAFDEAHKADPVKAKGLDGTHLQKVVATPYFPACESGSAVATSEQPSGTP